MHWQYAWTVFPCNIPFSSLIGSMALYRYQPTITTPTPFQPLHPNDVLPSWFSSRWTTDPAPATLWPVFFFFSWFVFLFLSYAGDVTVNLLRSTLSFVRGCRVQQLSVLLSSGKCLCQSSPQHNGWFKATVLSIVMNHILPAPASLSSS